MVVIGAAKREMNAVLDYTNPSLSTPSNSTEDFLSKMLAEGFMMPDDPVNENMIEGSADDATTFGTKAVNTIVDNVFENISTAIKILSERDISVEYKYDETNDTFTENSTVTNSTLHKNETMSPLVCFLIAFGVGMFICIVIILAYCIQKKDKSSSHGQTKKNTPSEVATKYQAFFPKIDEKDELNDIEVGASDFDSNPVGEQDGGVIRKNQALVPYSSSKPKKHGSYYSLPYASDFDGNIIAQTGDELEEVVTTNKAVKDSKTQTSMEEKENALTAEDLDSLNEKCKECKSIGFIDD